MHFDGTNDKIVIPPHNDFDFGTGDFTIEMWFKCADASAHNMIFSYKYDDFQIYAVNTPAYLNLDCTSWNGTDFSLASKTPIEDGLWYHGVIDRLDGVSRLFLNGVCEDFDPNDEITSNLME